MKDKIPESLNSIVDTVLAYNPKEASKTKATEISESGTRPTVKAWTTSISHVLDNSGFRLDATHYDPVVANAKKRLEQSGYALKPLSELASVELRGQFTRIWATDEKHGVKYLNATDLLSLMSLGVPSGGQRFLSNATETNIPALIIRQGWLLMTCSGTLGRLFYVPNRLDGWAATHDLIRIVPKDKNMTGFLHAWLTTSIAQALILSHTHGGQIDHITDDQVKECLVPMLPESEIKRLHDETMQALRARERAVESLLRVWQDAESALEK